ncbi:MAG: hypothetical protein JRI66_11305 [Deltaproteobacteria bacterium]|nr:hypothetical protein [Deltaproteobacteria bacterium]
MTAPEIAQALAGDRRPVKTSSGWLTWCPAHPDDKTPSLHLSETADGKLLVHCFGGCPQEAVIAALKERGLWPSKNSGKGRNTATPPGLNLKELAEAKGLQIDGPKGLKAWGVAQAVRHRATVIRIPYMNQAGEEVAVRFRLALDGSPRFVWRRGDKILLYGMWRLNEFRQVGWVLLLEGESDCWTAWLYDLPALGLPGKPTFRPEWAEYFQGLVVYLWQEPDAPELSGKLVKHLPGLMVIRPPEGLKDLNEAHLKGEDMPALVERLKAAAIPAEALCFEDQMATIRELEKAALPVLSSPDPLELVRVAIACQGYGGDVREAMITYLAATSRLLAMRRGAMPVHLLLVSQSSSGKSYLVGIVLELLPEESYHIIDAGSPRVLIYDDADLRHRVLVFGEADSLPAGEDNPAASAVRNLLQEHRLRYKVTIRNLETGEHTVKEVQKPGPTVMISTSTRRLGHQLDTRVFSLKVSDSPEKINAALLAQAELELHGAAAPDEALIAFQAYLQALAPWQVVVPFIKELAVEIGRKATAPRIMRDFARLTSLIKSVAIIRHRHRQSDEMGRVVAQIEDYSMVYDLVGPMYETTLTGASEELRATVQAVAEMLDQGEQITATSLAARLGIHRSTASRHINTAIKRGWIVNRETKKGQPWDLQLGEPLPEKEGLPDPETLRKICKSAECAPDGETAQHTENNIDNGECCTVAGDTDCFSPHRGDEDVEVRL